MNRGGTSDCVIDHACPRHTQRHGQEPLLWGASGLGPPAGREVELESLAGPRRHE